VCVGKPGGRDRKGRSILTIPAGKTEDLSVDRLGDTLSYLTQSPRYTKLFLLPMIFDRSAQTVIDFYTRNVSGFNKTAFLFMYVTFSLLRLESSANKTTGLYQQFGCDPFSR